MNSKKVDLGPTGEAVRENIANLREKRNLTYAELSRRLQSAGHEIPPLGLRRIESGERKVTVDDLVALAAVMEGTITALLTPRSLRHSVMARATGTPDVPGDNLRIWIREGGPHLLDPDHDARFHIPSNPKFVESKNVAVFSEELTEAVKHLVEVLNLDNPPQGK